MLRQRHVGGRGGYESVFRNSSNRVVSFTDTEHDRSLLVQFRNWTGRSNNGSDNRFLVFHMETSWCRVFASRQWCTASCMFDKYPGQRAQLLDPGFHTAIGARVQHDGGRLVMFNLPEGRTIRAMFKNPSSLSVVSLSRGTGVIFAPTQVHSSFLTRSRPNTAKHSCTREKLCSLSSGCWWCLWWHLVWVTMSLKSYRFRLARKRWTMWRNRRHLVLQHSKVRAPLIKSCWISTVWHISRVIHGARCASNLEGVIHHIENEKRRRCASTSVCYGYMGDEGPLQIACFVVETETSSGAIHATMVPDSKKMDMSCVVAGTAKCVRDLVYSQHADSELHEWEPVDIRSTDVREETCTTIWWFDPLASHGWRGGHGTRRTSYERFWAHEDQSAFDRCGRSTFQVLRLPTQRSSGYYHMNRRVGSYFTRTDLEVFFLKSQSSCSHSAWEAPSEFIFVLGLCRAVSLHFCHYTLNVFWKQFTRVRPVCLQRDAGGLSWSPTLASCTTIENWLRFWCCCIWKCLLFMCILMVLCFYVHVYEFLVPCLCCRCIFVLVCVYVCVDVYVGVY